MIHTTFEPIGIIHSPCKEAKNTPIQAAAAQNAEGRVEVFEQYTDGLMDLEGFSHIILIYHFHLCRNPKLKVIPFLDKEEHGIFATRAACRPNPVGLSVVRLNGIEDNILHVNGLDIIDGTPLLDIKPYVPEFDHVKAGKIGWLKGNTGRLHETLDDGRFIDG